MHLLFEGLFPFHIRVLFKHVAISIPLSSLVEAKRVRNCLFTGIEFAFECTVQLEIFED